MSGDFAAPAETVGPAEPQAMAGQTRTVGFVDLAGFTTATVAHGDLAAADLAERTVELTEWSLGPSDVLVKSLGDAVMVVSESPRDALGLSARICARADQEAAFPLLRVGLHHGPVIQRHEDFYGTTVNVAARLASQAGPGQVLTTGAVAAAAVDADMGTEFLGPTPLRGIPDPIDSYAVTPCPAEPDRVIDPVCHMAVERSFAAAVRTVEGTSYYFCSTRCVESSGHGPNPDGAEPEPAARSTTNSPGDKAHP